MRLFEGVRLIKKIKNVDFNFNSYNNWEEYKFLYYTILMNSKSLMKTGSRPALEV